MSNYIRKNKAWTVIALLMFVGLGLTAYFTNEAWAGVIGFVILLIWFGYGLWWNSYQAKVAKTYPRR